MTDQALVTAGKSSAPRHALDSETKYHVGDGWRYQCKSCGHEVGIDRSFPKECPGCHAGGWWGHLAIDEDIPKVSQEIDGEDGTQKEWDNNSDSVSRGIRTRNRILSHDFNAVDGSGGENNGIFEPPTPRGKGRPKNDVPDDIILELASQGFSSRAIVKELAKQGTPGISYKTIQRRLQASLL